MTNSFIRVPPDSSGKRLFTQEHTVDGFPVHSQVFHVGDPDLADSLLKIDNRGSASVRFSEGQPTLSGFGALKTVQARAIGVYEGSLESYAALFSTIETNGGTSTHRASESSQVLATTTSLGSRALMTTNRYHYYLPGSSNLVIMTVSTGDTGKSGNTRRWGAFDENDGVFFELSDTIVYAVIRSSTTGVVTETRVAQQDWNSDSLNGTGLSEYVLSITNINVFWIDYQWLGAGRVRFGIFAPDGSRLICHSFENAGSRVLPYMRTGTLPIASEIINTDITGSGSELRVVCGAVYTEGDFSDYTFWRFADVDVSRSNILADTSLFTLRTQSTVNNKHNSVVVYPETLNIWCTAPVSVTIWQESEIDSPAWAPLSSVLEVSYSGTVSTTTAQKFKTIYFNAGATSLDLDKFFEKNDEGIMTKADGTAEKWSFSISPLTGAETSVTANLSYKELW